MRAENPKWFFGVIDQPGIWATSHRPGGEYTIRNYKCAQNMDPTWVAYLGQPPEISMPNSIILKDVIEYLNQDTLPPHPDRTYYPDENLAKVVKDLFQATSTIDKLKAKIRDRAY